MNTDIYVERNAAEVTVAHTDLAIRGCGLRGLR